MYSLMCISEDVLAFTRPIEHELKETFEKIDETAEYNQLKVISAMQKNKLSAECFNSTNGYGYSDIGRDTLDEAPFAYRSLEKIREVINDTVEIREIIRPIYNYKTG